MTDHTAPRELVLHGHRMSYRTAGEGPVIALVHGITSTSDTWRELLPLLAQRHTVVAPDLLGHGDSAKPRGDYSLGAYASAVRDLMAALGHDSATVVGHSLGGGVAMQFAYQYLEMCERLDHAEGRLRSGCRDRSLRVGEAVAEYRGEDATHVRPGVGGKC